MLARAGVLARRGLTWAQIEMTNAESISLRDFPAETPAQKHSENGDQARLTPAQLNSTDSSASSIAPHANHGAAAEALHWEHFLKGRCQLEVEILT